MLNKPRVDMIETSPQLLAGEKFPANQQCELIFGPNSKVCPFNVTVSIFGHEVDQVSGMTRKQKILLYTVLHISVYINPIECINFGQFSFWMVFVQH